MSGRTVLVAGGAGYIGSHTARELERAGFTPVVFDDFSAGCREFCEGRRTIEGDLLRPGDIRAALAADRFEAVLHFASLIQVGESYADPGKYWRHNVGSSLNLLEAVRDAGVRNVIFSSSAAVYGAPREIPIPETHPLDPISPYGRTKEVVERMLADWDRAYGVRSISLRYFNASGADPAGGLGERHVPETHLIPNVLASLTGGGTPLSVFGTDFDTPDGTCLRDYIHVTDLARAHVLALERLVATGRSDVFNLGTGRGYSVLEVIREAEAVTGRTVRWTAAPRRPGDPAVLLASNEKARRDLQWAPRLSGIGEILRTAWEWHSRR